MMQIYLIKRNDDIGYDEFEGFVIAAYNESEALQLLQNSLYHPSVWSDNFTIVSVGVSTLKDPQIILKDFNSAG